MLDVMYSSLGYYIKFAFFTGAEAGTGGVGGQRGSRGAEPAATAAEAKTGCSAEEGGEDGTFGVRRQVEKSR